MKALVVAHRSAPWLEALPGAASPCLLPLGGRPLLAHVLDDLAAAGIREALVTVGAGAHEIEREVGDGRRFGLDVRWVLARPGDSIDALVARSGATLGGEFVLARADVLRTPCAAALLEHWHRSSADAVHATLGGADAGLAVVRTGSDADAATVEGVGLAGDAIEIDSVAAFHRAALDIAGGRFEGLVLTGRERDAGVRIGRHATVDATGIVGPAWIGAGAHVVAGASLLGHVSIGEDAVIDAGARLERTVVGPRSYVGRMVEIRDAVVWGDRLVPVDSGEAVVVGDDLVVADLDALSRRRVDLLHRAGGLLLLALSMPLWAAAFVLSAGATTRTRLRGNSPSGTCDLDYDSVEWDTDPPLLRRLPRLLDVVRGRLRLVGVEPLAPPARRPLEGAPVHGESWRALREQAPAGLVGPWLTDVPEGGDDDERRVVEAGYAALRGPGLDLLLLARAARLLASPRAWVAKRAGKSEPSGQAATAAGTTAR